MGGIVGDARLPPDTDTFEVARGRDPSTGPGTKATSVPLPSGMPDIANPAATSRRTPSHRALAGVRRALALLVTSGALACGPAAPRPVVGTVLGGTFNNAARLAYADDIAADGPPVADTVFRGEPNALAATSIGVASELLGHTGLVAVIGHTNSSTSLAVAQLYNDAQVVQLAPTSTAELYREAGPFSFRMVPSDAEQGPAIAQAIAQRFPVESRVALLYVNDDYGRGLRTAVRRALDTTRYPIVTDLPHLDGAASGTSVLSDVGSVAAAQPDVIVWLGRPTTLHSVLPAIRRALGAVPVLASDATTSWVVLGNADGVLTDVEYLDFLDTEALPAVRAMRARYRARFGADIGAGEVLAYDAMRLILRGLREGATTGDALRQWLDARGRSAPAFPGVTGPLRFSSVGDVDRSFVRKRIPPPTAAPRVAPR